MSTDEQNLMRAATEYFVNDHFHSMYDEERSEAICEKHCHRCSVTDDVQPPKGERYRYYRRWRLWKSLQCGFRGKRLSGKANAVRVSPMGGIRSIHDRHSN